MIGTNVIGRPRITKEQAIREGWFTPNESGLCRCGCGRQTTISACSVRSRGMVKGEHKQYICGHSPQDGELNPNWKEGASLKSYNGIHDWLNKKYPRVGICEWCNRSECKTEYALIGEQHIADREAYVELCQFCHRRFDVGGSRNYNAKLSEDSVHTIRECIAAGISDLLISREYGVSPAAIWNIRKGKTWVGLS